MDIPLHKIHDIKRLLYTDLPSYLCGNAWNPKGKDIPYEAIKRLINEVLDILSPKARV